MPVLNADIARIFDTVADLLEIGEANPFRVRAYRRAARTVGGLPQSVAGMLREGKDLAELEGIGKTLADKIREIVETGTLRMLENLKREIPVELVELLRIPQVGPKHAALLYRELGITSLEELARAAEAGQVQHLKGFGRKTEAHILAKLRRRESAKPRTKLAEAEQIAEPLLTYLQKVKGVKKVIAAGSYRRRRETVQDLDILVTCRNGAPVMEQFVRYEDVKTIVAQGKTRCTVLLRSDFQVDLRVVPEVCYGAALHYFTGAKEHNVAVRRLGVQKGLKINEYGVFRADDTRRIAGRTEAEVFGAVDLPWIPPELRENRGEIEAARNHALPRLATLEQIKGDLHIHTRATDGHSTIEEMVAAARKLGYSYLAVTEHSKRVTIAHGMDRKRLERQIEQIDALNAQLADFRILKGIEVDILEDGSLDLPDAVLKKLDLTVCAIHSKFDLPSAKQTARIIRAMDNPFFNIFAHPTGRLINKRDACDIDMERVMTAALERGCVLELNAHPDRLDLTDMHCRLAREMGLKVSIATDAHHAAGLFYMRFGINQARRGWLESEDVLNTRSADEVLKLLRRS